ncbi:MAG: WXG100-like domain-containing protein, partial [Kineosporiaceae bacterium]
MDVGGVLERFAPPPGDAAQVRAAAEQWRRAADQLQGAADAASRRAASLVGSWSGP